MRAGLILYNHLILLRHITHGAISISMPSGLLIWSTSCGLDYNTDTKMLVMVDLSNAHGSDNY